MSETFEAWMKEEYKNCSYPDAWEVGTELWNKLETKQDKIDGLEAKLSLIDELKKDRGIIVDNISKQLQTKLDKAINCLEYGEKWFHKCKACEGKWESLCGYCMISQTLREINEGS